MRNKNQRIPFYSGNKRKRKKKEEYEDLLGADESQEGARHDHEVKRTDR